MPDYLGEFEGNWLSLGHCGSEYDDLPHLYKILICTEDILSKLVETS